MPSVSFCKWTLINIHPILNGTILLRIEQCITYGLGHFLTKKNIILPFVGTDKMTIVIVGNTSKTVYNRKF